MGWSKYSVRSMCGSGTILCEALMHYCRIPAQALRKKFGFYNLPEFNRNEWNKVKADSDSNVRPLLKNIIRGSDKSPDAIKIARKNLSRLPILMQ